MAEPKMPAGKRQNQMFDFIKQERVPGAEFIFTMGHVRQLEHSGLTKPHAYRAIRQLAAKGLIRAEKQAGGGILISLLEKGGKAEFGRKSSERNGGGAIETIRAAAESEIKALEVKKAAKQKFLAVLDIYEKLMEKREA
jgi:hypothetical protein